ncbi:MAG: hypothetical protein JOZ69_11735 [Myxococcales bacterium]|nr:hypothetical protein [Myxococcales bacterium]
MCRSALLLAAAFGPLLSGCDTSAGTAGLNAPCERDRDCARGLTCSAGVCASPEASNGRGVPDAASSQGDADDGPAGP